jgi:outer membrane immunogenic protein
MKRLFFGVAVTAALIGTHALAADMPWKTSSAPVASWTGCYLDAGGGYGMWNQDNITETFPGLTPITGTTTSGGSGWLGRFGGGCDYQFGQVFNGNVVIGVLADYDAASIHGTYQDPSTGFGGDEKLSSSWAAGGRIGYAFSPAFLTYFDGGFTQARFNQVNFLDLSAVPVVPVGRDIAARTQNGWFIGSGTETALGGLIPGLPAGFFLRTEYRYSSFNSADVPIVGTATGNHLTPYEQTIASTLVWKFNWIGH